MGGRLEMPHLCLFNLAHRPPPTFETVGGVEQPIPQAVNALTT